MASKNAPKDMLVSPSITATVENGGIVVSLNSDKTAYVVNFKMLIGQSSTKTSDSGKSWSTAGEVEMPETIEIGGTKYWINLSSGWIETKSGRRKVGKPRISLSPVKEQETKTAPTATIPW